MREKLSESCPLCYEKVDRRRRYVQIHKKCAEKINGTLYIREGESIIFDFPDNKKLSVIRYADRVHVTLL